MPPQNPENPGPLDPNRIDVSLSLMGEEGATAITALTAQISLLHKHLAQFGGADPSSVARAQAAVARETTTSPGGVIPSGPSAMASDVARAAAHVQATAEGRTPPEPAEPAPVNEEGLPSPRSSRPGPPPEDHRDLRLANMSARRRLWRGKKGAEKNPKDPPSIWEEYRDSENENVQNLGGAVDRWNSIYAARERQQASRRTGTFGRPSDFETPGINAGNVGDELSSGASMPSGGGRGGGRPPIRPGEEPGADDPNVPTWYRSLMADPVAYERMQEGLRIPQFGEFTIQNKLELGRNFFANRAFRSYQQAASGIINGRRLDELSPEDRTQLENLNAGQNQGRAAALLHQASQNSAQIYAAHQEFRRFQGHMLGLQQTGIQMGYDPGATVTLPGTNMGLRLPDFSQGGALREGLRQQLTEWRLRAQAGITGTQAKEIIGGVNEGGFSGAEGMNLATNAIAPLVRQGLDPGMTAQMMTESLRNGNASVRDVADSLDHLGDTAKTTRQTLEQTQAGLEEFTQTAESMGALRVEGTRAGRQMMDTTGLTGGQLSQAVQSPLVQAQAMYNYGVLPNAFGLLPGTEQTSSIYGAVDMAMKAASSFGNRTTILPDGRKITGREMQIAQAAQFLGIPRETFERLVRQRHMGPHLSRAGGLLHDYAAATDRAESLRPKEQGPNLPIIGHLLKPTGRDPHGNAHADAIEKQLSDTQWPAIQRELERAGSDLRGNKARDWKKEVDRISHEHGTQRAHDAMEFIREHNKAPLAKDQQQIGLKFTGPAAKWFEQVKNLPDPAKSKANNGGESLPSQILHGTGDVLKFAHNLPGTPF